MIIINITNANKSEVDNLKSFLDANEWEMNEFNENTKNWNEIFISINNSDMSSRDPFYEDLEDLREYLKDEYWRFIEQ